ncbi:UDP-glycosyltransferase 74F2 [Platanthera zijinensis]|uniref:UDP-glycosyltransferase 74F2 n=1 Tax=Platanthera zijinensis TaxID=2320716 RepID=A0AAP0BH06_9ASPA
MRILLLYTLSYGMLITNVSTGALLPSTYLDDRIPADSTYAINLYPPETDNCRPWVTTLGLGPFLWVVRSSEANKLPPGFIANAKTKGNLVVSWAPQLEILARKGAGGFVGREEVEPGVQEIMEGERRDEFRRRAVEWREASRGAMAAGGSSALNIIEFL